MSADTIAQTIGCTSILTQECFFFEAFLGAAVLATPPLAEQFTIYWHWSSA